MKTIQDSHTQWTCLKAGQNRIALSSVAIGISTYTLDSFNLQVYTSEDAIYWENIYENDITVSFFQNINLIIDTKNKIARFVYIKHACTENTSIQATAIINPHLIPFHNVNIIYDKCYYDGLISSLYKETYEKPEIRFSLDYINDGDSILELGASIGGVSTVILKNKRIKHYTCIEANPQLIEIIQKNHILNNVKADIKNLVATSNQENKTHKFYIRKNFLASSLSDKDPFLKSVEVQSIYLQDLLDQISPNFIICDIEGAEFDVFKNLNLSCVNCISIELHYTKTHEVEEFFDFMEKQNFKIMEGDRFFTKQTVCLFKKSI